MRQGRRPGAAPLPRWTAPRWTALRRTSWHWIALWCAVLTWTVLALPSLAPGAAPAGGLTVLVLALAAAALVAPRHTGSVTVTTTAPLTPHHRSWPDGEPPRQQHPDTPGRVRPRAPGRD